MGETGAEVGGHIAFEGSKGHESTPAKAKFLYARRDLFPNMPIAGWIDDDEKLVQEWGWVLAPKNAGEQGLKTRSTDYSQKEYGRASFVPFIFESKDHARFSIMYKRGGGGANERTGDFNAENYDVPREGKPGAMALGDRQPTLVEAEERSVLLHEKGIRVRLPIMGFEIDGVQTRDGYKTVEELVASGLLKSYYAVDKPVVSYWAKRNSYTFWDAMATKDVNSLLKSQVTSLRIEDGKDIRPGRVADLIEKGGGEREWFDWLVDMGAEQMVTYAREGFIHPSFSGQNMDLSIEAGDLVSHEHNFGLRPLTQESSENDKYMFAEQMRSMLELIISLREHFLFNNGGDPYGHKAKNELKRAIRRYVAEVAKTEVGMLMIDELLGNKNIIIDFATSNPTKDIFVNELKKQSWLNKLGKKLGVR